MQRLEGAIEDMNNDKDFVNYFVSAIGNVLKFTSRTAEYERADMQEGLIRDRDSQGA